ncbi:MAG TPA: septum formation initiator family protein [Terriglobales bacterium]|nr:septum formation initiator family protein [Terriglobales bacterium]
MKAASKVFRQIFGWVYDSRRRIATAGVVVLAGLMGFHVIFGANGVFVYTKKRAEYRELESELKSLQRENERLNQNIKALQTDPKTIEKEAREQLRYARPGEVIYSLPNPKQTHNSTAKK